MAPWVLGFVAFVLYPMAASLYYSFTSYDLLTSPHWVGLANYRFMLWHDPLFWQSVRNTLWIIGVGVPIGLVAALGTGLLLARPRRGATVYRTIYYLPSIAPAVAATLAFGYLLDPATGPVNRLLGTLHLPQPLWFQDPRFAKPGLVLLGLWGIGPTIVIFLAGLLTIPAELYEVAAIEGASRWQRFRHVTLPTLSPVILFVVVIGVIDGFQYFAQAFVAARIASPSTVMLGAPQESTMFYSVRLYESAFTNFHMGYASALAWVLLLVTVACTVAIIRVFGRWVHYEAATR
ncbi:MAG: carbohydrate ABC transporter permease [Acidimicrobiales bacterium]